MPRVKHTQKKVRLNLDLNATVRQSLEDLRIQTQADSLCEVVRRSIAVYGLLWSEQESGSTLVIRRKGSETEVRLI